MKLPEVPESTIANELLSMRLLLLVAFEVGCGGETNSVIGLFVVVKEDFFNLFLLTTLHT